MSAAYYVVKNGIATGITITGLTNPNIKKNIPHGNPGGDMGPVNKSPGAPSAVTGK